MDPNKSTGTLSPAQQEAYNKVMGTALPKSAPPIATPTPLSPAASTTPPVNIAKPITPPGSPEPTAPASFNTSQQVQSFTSFNSKAAPITPLPTADASKTPTPAAPPTSASSTPAVPPAPTNQPFMKTQEVAGMAPTTTVPTASPAHPGTVIAAPVNPAPFVPTPTTAPTASPVANTKKAGGGTSPIKIILFSLVAIILLIAYGIVWSLIFGLSLPFTIPFLPA